MFFFMKPSVVNVDCFTSRADVYEYFPVAKSSEYLPEWWKKLPKEVFIKNSFYPDPTMKTCSGFIDFYKNGFTIPLWSEMYIQVNNDNSYNWQFSDGISLAEPHNAAIVSPGFINSNEWCILKLISPWRIKSKEKFCFVGNVWNTKNFDEVIIPPGVLDFVHQKDTNIQLMFRNIPNKKIMLETNRPLVNIIPMSDKKLKISHHLISNEEYERMLFKRSFFINTSRKIENIKKTQKKCPFAH